MRQAPVLILIVLVACLSEQDSSPPLETQATNDSIEVEFIQEWVEEPELPIFVPSDDYGLFFFVDSFKQALDRRDSAAILSYFYHGEPFVEKIVGYKRGRPWLPYYFYDLDGLIEILKHSIQNGFMLVDNDKYIDIPRDEWPTDELSNESSEPLDTINSWSPHDWHEWQIKALYPELASQDIFVNFPFSNYLTEAAVEKMEAIVISDEEVPLYKPDHKKVFKGKKPDFVQFLRDTVLYGCRYDHKYFYYNSLVGFMGADHPDSGHYVICVNDSVKRTIPIWLSLGAQNMHRLYICRVDKRWQIVGIRLPGKFAKGEGC